MSQVNDYQLLLKSQRTAVESLERVIADIRSGVIVEFVGMAVMADDTYRLEGGSTEDRHKVSGMLLELAIERLK